MNYTKITVVCVSLIYAAVSNVFINQLKDYIIAHFHSLRITAKDNFGALCWLDFNIVACF